MLNDIERFLASGAWSSNTIDRYRRAVQLLISEVGDVQGLDPSSFRSWLESHNWGSATQWLNYNAVKMFLRWKYGESHPALLLKIKRSDSPPQRVLKINQVQALLQTFDTSTPIGRRNLAMACLFLDSGLRVHEMCALELRYLDLEERSLRVKIKGGAWEAGVFSKETASYLSSWLADREGIAKPGIRTVFVGIYGNTPGMPMTRSGVQCIMRTWAKQAEIGALSPHDFRRSFATLATRAGAPSRVLQKAGRWSNIAMVEHYTRSIEARDFDPYFPVSSAME